MKLLKFLLPSILGAFCFGSLSANEGSATDKRDMKAVSDYVDSKSVPLSEISNSIKISGDIRTEWSNIHTRSEGKKIRGSGTGENPYIGPEGQEKKGGKAPTGTNEFNIEANLTVDYKADRSYGCLKLQMSNSGGLLEVPFEHQKKHNHDYMNGSGSVHKINLRKAFMGYNVWEQGTSRFNVEIGRQRLYDRFDSKVQFNSIFDGILAKYSTNVADMYDFEGKVGAFVVDSAVRHFSFVGEASFLNISDLGLDLKYSLIRWNKKGENRYGKRNALGTRFTNSQLTAIYNVSEDLTPIKTQLYGAFLRNHDAKRNDTIKSKAPNAFYLGCLLGSVAKKGDYAVDIAYHYVQAQAIAERDISLMGRDTPGKTSMYVGRHDAGYANYKGWKFDAFYALTDNLTLNAYYQNISQVSRNVGGKYHSNEIFLGLLFAF